MKTIKILKAIRDTTEFYLGCMKLKLKEKVKINIDGKEIIIQRIK